MAADQFDYAARIAGAYVPDDPSFGPLDLKMGALLEAIQGVIVSNLAIAQTTALAALYAADQRRDDVRAKLEAIAGPRD